ncbi:polyadenylate-binding protein-interacting protein 2 isoform X2 [Diaphorina citri]|uniref:Polyadenylate-binding protein-interacting protein 2 isoform X2 n=1 Tax=Diaphorina citri TaxID=121845 RepID=A0A3Q0ISR1_DIACI|nr:polyadenylate-binding protein-interacting protein 2 isoform X2 [Diaphorina citri]KAI5705938.1 hypothetical protein M8J75_003238 [Diaphorina citri]
MQLKLPTVDSDFVIDCASISSFFSDVSDFPDGLVDSPIIDGDFSEYMWMENADEFDKEVMQQLEEEALMEECIEAMLEEEDDQVELRNLTDSILASSQSLWSDVEEDRESHGCVDRTTDLCHLIGLLRMDEKHGVANLSTLNPNAAEFVPQQPKTMKYDSTTTPH